MAIVCRELSVQRGGREVVRGFTHTFEAGRVTALVGPNGSGKSSLLKTLYGYLPPGGGTLEFDGKPPLDWSPLEFAKMVGVCPQEAEPSLDFEVGQLLALRHGGDLQAAWQGAEELPFLGLAPLFDQKLSRLSGGERQRVRLGLALGASPSWLILDEPANHLDLSTAWSLFEGVRKIPTVGAILALHDLATAARFCDYLLVLKDGLLVAEGPAESVLTSKLLSEIFGLRGELICEQEHRYLQIRGVKFDE